jgi:hypothetical protein
MDWPIRLSLLMPENDEHLKTRIVENNVLQCVLFSLHLILFIGICLRRNSPVIIVKKELSLTVDNICRIH